ncbi:MAG: tetratricopeptide repeat protein [Deltaproteobacteria bacterium]
MFYKLIIQGKFYFLNRGSYDKLVSVIQNRNQIYYKNEIVFKELEFLDDENFMISIPRYVGNHTDKVWKNTANLFENCAQFAVSGRVMMWKIEEGKILESKEIEPSGSRSAILNFNRARDFIKEGGKETEALAELSKSLENYNRNALAYERRAVVNLKLGNLTEAKEDFQKSINVDNSVPESHLGLGRILLKEGDLETSLKHLNFAIKTSIALQAIHWQARRAKAELHISREEWDEAEFELKLLINRGFDRNDPNFQRRRQDIFNYGIVKYNQYLFDIALDLFEKAMSMPYGKDSIPEKDKFYYLGMTKKNLGRNGYIHDLSKSAELGNEDAIYMLEEIL